MAPWLRHSIAPHEVLRLNPSCAHFLLGCLSFACHVKLVSALYSVFYTVFNSAVIKRPHTGEERVHSVGSQTYNNLISIWIIQSYRLPLLKALIAQQE